MDLLKNQKSIQAIFWILIGIFIITLSYFIIPVSVFDKRAIFPFMAILAIAFFLLGITLIFLTLKLKVKGKLKKFLILTGASSTGFLVSVVLHNLFYALAVLTEHIILLHYLMEFLHVAFFITAIFICPIYFLAGAIGSIIFFIKKRKKK